MQTESNAPPWFILVWIGIVWVAPIVVGYRIGVRKNRMGWLWGALLGWFGVIILALLSPKWAVRRY